MALGRRVARLPRQRLLHQGLRDARRTCCAPRHHLHAARYCNPDLLIQEADKRITCGNACAAAQSVEAQSYIGHAKKDASVSNMPLP